MRFKVVGESDILEFKREFKLSAEFFMNYEADIDAKGAAWINHSNLGDPNWNITDSNAGQITGLAPNYQMRRLQFALRLDF